MAYWSILVAAIAAHVLGFLWHGPLFGKQWMTLMNLGPNDMNKAKQKGMAKTYLISFAASLVTATVLRYFVYQRVSLILPAFPGIAFTLKGAILNGALVGLVIWFGFVTTKTLASVLWEGRPWKLYLLNTAYDLVNFLLMGAIVGGLSGFSWA